MYSVLDLYFVLDVVRLEFGDVAKSYMCFGDLAKSQTVLQIKIRTTEHARHLTIMAHPLHI